MNPTYFLITIDTEGDNLWSAKSSITTRNAAYLERFQQVCERFGFKPCYLTNYEMAIDPVFQAFGRDVLARNTAEIGMHLHAWNSPPLYPAIDHHSSNKAYLIDYPLNIMRDKIDWLTKCLEDIFAVKMLSHRAGRWAFNSHYAHLLVEYGYQVDCSVTPHVDWSGTKGAHHGAGGTDYRSFPERAYFMDLDRIDKPGNSTLLEIPMTTRPKYPDWFHRIRQTLDGIRGKTRPRAIRWLRPQRRNTRDMISLSQQVCSSAGDYVQFMLHSSELMPGGSPTFDTEASIEALYATIEVVFQHLALHCSGTTLSGYYDHIIPRQ